MDELTFIISHQTFELWFPIVLMSIDEVIGELTSDKLNIVAAEMQIRKITSLFKLFSSMIRMPQTMTASDYLAFRSQLQGGSGAESIGFRLIEISLGLRDPLYLAKLHTMNLMTEELSARLCQPSLSDVYLNLLKKHEIISEGANDDAVAYAIASELRPTEAIDKHSEPIWLGESLIDLEQSIDLWRQYHLSMVRRMIGYRPSLGVGGHEPVKSGTHDASTDRPIDGVAHLIQTLRLRIFPYLWSARSKISEDALMAYRA
jgi:tryptophan 2,3-dioxygenase